MIHGLYFRLELQSEENFWDDMFTNIKQWKDDLDIEIKTTWQEYKPTINELLNFRDGDKAIQYLVERGLNTNSLMK